MLVGLADGLCGGIPCSLGQGDESSDIPEENKQVEASVDTAVDVLHVLSSFYCFPSFRAGQLDNHL